MTKKANEAVRIFNDKAFDYAEKFENVNLYKDGLDRVCEMTAQNGKVLDLACGPGNISKYLISKRKDFDLLGVDLAPNMIKIASEENPQARFIVYDIKSISSLNTLFDAIVVGFGLPYLSKSEISELIRTCFDKLNKNGLLYISTMEGNYSNSGYQKSSDGASEMYIYFHQGSDIKKKLTNAGFKIVFEKRQPYLENNKTRYTDYIVVGKK